MPIGELVFREMTPAPKKIVAVDFFFIVLILYEAADIATRGAALCRLFFVEFVLFTRNANNWHIVYNWLPYSKPIERDA